MPLVFLNSALLAAAAAALAPVIIHLMNRRKAREDYLPTLRFLKAGFAANRRRMRVKHLLILLLRVLAIMLLAATLARPAHIGTFFSRKGTAPVEAVVVLDNSVSMAYERGGVKRLDSAKALAKEALATLPAGSRVALVVTGLGPRGEVLDKDFTFRAAAMADNVAAVDASACGGDCTSALARAYSMLEQARGSDISAGREVYVVSDLAAHAWPAPEALKPPRDAQTVILDVGSDVNENFHVDSVAAEWRTFPAPPHAALSAAVGSGSLAAERLLEVNLSGAKRAERLLQMAPNSRLTEGFDVAILTSLRGPVQGRVALVNDDPIRADNSRYFTVPQVRGIKCLVLGVPGRAKGADSAFFISNALEPPGLAGATGASVRYEDADSLKQASLDNADVVILADMPEAPDAIWRTLEQLTAAGKGLVIFLGQTASPQSYDPLLKTIFGVVLGSAESLPQDQFRRLDVLSLDHPMLAAFAGGRNGNLSGARMLRWRRLEAVGGAVAPASQLARLEGGDPVLFAAPMGGGHAVLAAFAPIPADTDLPLRAPFVPLINEMARYAAGERARGAEESTGFEVGSVVTLPVDRLSGATQAEVITPLDVKPATVAIAPGTTSFVYRAFFPGNYVVRLPGKEGPVERGFSVNIPASESSAGRISPEALETSIQGACVAKDLSDKPLKRVWGRTRGARELFDIFLVVTVIVLAVEEFLANRVYRDAARVEGGR